MATEKLYSVRGKRSDVSKDIMGLLLSLNEGSQIIIRRSPQKSRAYVVYTGEE
jgi:hypothetical protein